MTVQLVSINPNIDWEEQFQEVLEIINISTSDIILFPGHTLADMQQLKALRNKITNKHSVVFLEVQERNFSKNSLFIIRNGKVIDLMTNQRFMESKDIDGDEFECKSFLKELKGKRIIRVKGFQILILQCGENNIINAHSDATSKAEFRFSDNPELTKEWNDIFSKIDIVLNPIHTRMNRQALMAKRREYLSSDGRAYFSVNNTENFKQKSCHYAYVDSKPIDCIQIKNDTDSTCSWIYKL